ncbi:MAG: magnesium transporter, partial [Actinobacteria bacterium]
MAHTRVYCKGVLEAEDYPVADISDYLERPDTVVWVDYCAPSPEEMEELKAELGFHELAVEDALGQHQRPKVERYPGHLFMVCHSVHLDEATGDLSNAEIDAFINSRWLVTVRKDEAFPLDAVLARWDKSQALAAHGVSYLLYGLLDVVIDGYFQPIDEFNAYYDAVSDKLLDDLPLRQSAEERARWFQSRRSLIEF